MNTAHRQIPASLCFRIILVPDKWPCDTNPEKVKKHHNHVGQTKEEEDDDDANFIGEGTSWLANIFQSPSILLMHTLAHTCHTIILHFMMRPLALEELFDNSYLLPNKFHPSYLSFVPTWVISPYWAVLGLSFLFFFWLELRTVGDDKHGGHTRRSGEWASVRVDWGQGWVDGDRPLRLCWVIGFHLLSTLRVHQIRGTVLEFGLLLVKGGSY